MESVSWNGTGTARASVAPMPIDLDQNSGVHLNLLNGSEDVDPDPVQQNVHHPVSNRDDRGCPARTAIALGNRCACRRQGDRFDRNARLGMDHLGGCLDGEPWIFSRYSTIPAISSRSCSQPTILSNVSIEIAGLILSRTLLIAIEQVQQAGQPVGIMEI